MTGAKHISCVNIMDKPKIDIYYEKCDQATMSTYLFFLDKLHLIEQLTPAYKVNLSRVQPKDCSECRPKICYHLGNIVWDDTIKHKIQTHQSYPSEYFIKVIINTCVIDNTIVNPPIKLRYDQTKYFSYIPLHYNKLLIIDALMHQGSWPRYLVFKNGIGEKYIYSEHSGVITIKNKRVDSIIVSTETDRINMADDNIFLPNNTDMMKEHEYLFHTHPNAQRYGGRLKEGIIYEFPSSNDLLNFIKYYNEGKAQASIIVSPEGIYVVRPVAYTEKYQIPKSFYDDIRKFILKLEAKAIQKLSPFLPYISDPNIFHNKIANDLSFIQIYNKFIEQFNLFIEYYPREKKNGEWCLRQINLPLISSN